MNSGDRENRHHKAGDARSSLKPYLIPVLILALLATFQSAGATVQMLSGSTEQLGNILGHGSTSYVVDYTYPSVAQVGSNLTIAVTLHVGQFSGLVGYITAYQLQVALDVGAQQLKVTLFGPGGFNSSSNLYPGGIWGPNNATFSLTAANTGLATGQSDNATFSVTLLDSVEVGYPYNQYETEPAMQGQGGTLLIQNDVASSTSSTSSSSTPPPTSGQSILPYAL
ncbi:MAG TPA: hypothetical protein VGS04_07075, partial [Nitrososphaerales archaeon]|nr:hypothetical protein [Nitrososphaerales archaeon]